VAGIGVAAIGVGTELYKLCSQWDSIADGITGKTGLVGTELGKSGCGVRRRMILAPAAPANCFKRNS
jgi:hypothetical protein